MLHRRDDAPDARAFDAGHDDGYRVGYYQRRSPATLEPENVPEQFSGAEARQSYVDGWQEGYFKGSRSREINR